MGMVRSGGALRSGLGNIFATEKIAKSQKHDGPEHQIRFIAQISKIKNSVIEWERFQFISKMTTKPSECEPTYAPILLFGT